MGFSAMCRRSSRGSVISACRRASMITAISALVRSICDFWLSSSLERLFASSKRLVKIHYSTPLRTETEGDRVLGLKSNFCSAPQAIKTNICKIYHSEGWKDLGSDDFLLSNNIFRNPTSPAFTSATGAHMKFAVSLLIAVLFEWTSTEHCHAEKLTG